MTPTSSGELFGRALTFERLSQTYPAPRQKIPTIAAFDAALDGGLTPGGVVLLGGAPGAGESTLLLQAAAAVAGAVYVTGEEECASIALRASRLGLAASDVILSASSDADMIARAIVTRRPPVAIVDSLQAIATFRCRGAMGSPMQLRAVTTALVEAA